jgi:hypothetical protein
MTLPGISNTKAIKPVVTVGRIGKAKKLDIP